ncbi:MAG: hypothetical protein AB7O48_02165 [Cyclobacteriaceae bacterium]
MIVSKPTSNTLVSFSLFLIITYAIIGMSVLQLVSDGNPPWYTYLVLAVMVPVAIFLTIKIFINYKRISIGNNTIEVHLPIRRIKKKYELKRIESWKESLVKTGKNSTFRELEIRFDDQFKLTLGHKEFTHYQEIHNYLTKKVGGKKVVD